MSQPICSACGATITDEHPWAAWSSYAQRDRIVCSADCGDKILDGDMETAGTWCMDAAIYRPSETRAPEPVDISPEEVAALRREWQERATVLYE